MTLSENSKLFYEFGPFRLDEKERRLLREGEEVTFSENGRSDRLTPKAFDLLLLLVKQSGEMVGREELTERIWPGTGEEKKGLAKRYTENVEAYQLYLKGHHHWSTFQPAELLTSINYYNEALKKDPNYALAYSGISTAYSVIGIYGPLSAREAMPKANYFAFGIIGQAHTQLGKYEEAASELQQAANLTRQPTTSAELLAKPRMQFLNGSITASFGLVLLK